MEFKINTADKPNLERLMKTDKAKATEVIQTFVGLMEEACSDTKDIPWIDLPKLFSRDMTFKQLIVGILRGSLDLKDLGIDGTYDALKEEVHPLSMLTPRKDVLNGGMKIYNWRNHFKLPNDAPVNEETIANIFRKLLRYYKYVDVEALAKAIINNQVTTFRGMDQAKTLPFYPALRYQQEKFGPLHVGKFYDNIGFFDCGTVPGSVVECPACNRPDLEELKGYKICLACNGGFEIAEVQNGD